VKKGSVKQGRGRPASRQPTIRSSLQLSCSPRRRSETPKRRRSGGLSSPETAGKQAKRDDRMADCPPPRISDIEDGEVGD
jgi:hypothetical protein